MDVLSSPKDHRRQTPPRGRKAPSDAPPNDDAPLPCPDALPKQHSTPEIYWDDVCLTWHAQ
jgi:hypothetical protein